jgi:hypothetical protein
MQKKEKETTTKSKITKFGFPDISQRFSLPFTKQSEPRMTFTNVNQIKNKPSEKLKDDG